VSKIGKYDPVHLLLFKIVRLIGTLGQQQNNYDYAHFKILLLHLLIFIRESMMIFSYNTCTVPFF